MRERLRKLLPVALVGLCVAAGLAPGAASGSDPAEGAGVPAAVSAAPEARRPLACSGEVCRRAPSAAWTFAAGFGGAALAAACLGRRHRT